MVIIPFCISCEGGFHDNIIACDVLTDRPTISGD